MRVRSLMERHRLHMLHAPPAHYEYEVVRRWWTLPPGCQLPLSHGGAYQLLFPGRPGGPAGPDVHDAVLCSMPATPGPLSHAQQPESQPVQRHIGDVEFHVRSSDWFAHQHHTDPRYNHVILHVVLICDDAQPTRCQAGHNIPLCSLYDLPATVSTMISTEHTISWPCQYLWPRMRQDERTSLLTQVGLLRFEQKAHLFVEQLRSTVPQAPYDLFSTCLIPALAEALAYGRDRDFFRVVGLRMLGRFDHVPEPLGRASLPSPLDTGRLQALTRLLAQLSSPDIWSSLRALLIPDVIYATNPLQSLRATFMESGLSLARTDILVCNVILPFAYAVALLEHDVALAECAHTLYLHLPGLPANRVTRMMGAQLGLAKAPSGGCQQQGLHYIYQHTCREKRCNVCLLGKYEI